MMKISFWSSYKVFGFICFSHRFSEIALSTNKHSFFLFYLFVAVIPDSLRVTSEAQTLNKVQHDSLELKCEVSKSTEQHSHISLAWYKKKADEIAVEVISLSRDFVVRAGSDYTQRHASGDIRLDKVGETQFKLTIYNLQSSDAGEFYCEGAEWIQDPDGSWYAMTHKRGEGTMVYVEGTG